MGILLPVVALHAVGVLDHDLWTPDEPRVGAVARSVSEGAWVIPTLNGAPFLEEPPLHAWCTGLVYFLLGPDPASRARIVSVIFGLGSLAATYLLARFLASHGGDLVRGRRVGAFAAFTLAVFWEHFHTAHCVVVDGALQFFTTASAYALIRGSTAGVRGSSSGWLSAGYVLASLAFLTKGVIGLAVPALALAAAAAALRDPRRLLRARPWLFPVLFALSVGPWLLAAYQEMGPRVLETLFADNTLGRILPAADGSRSHLRPFWFYAAYLPLDLLPGAFFVAGGIIRRLRERGRLEPAERFALDQALLWLGMGFVMLSLASTKREVYLLPFYPAAAILGGFWVDAFLHGKSNGPYERSMDVILPVLTLLLGAAPVVATALLTGASWSWAAIGSLCGAGAAAGGFVVARRGRRETALCIWAFGLAGVVLAADFGLVPALDRLKSLRDVSKRVVSLVPAGRLLCALEPDETTRAMFPLYTGMPLREVESVQALERDLELEGELFLLTVDSGRPSRSGRARKKGIQSVEHLRHTVLLEDIREGTRAFRLLRLERG